MADVTTREQSASNHNNRARGRNLGVSTRALLISFLLVPLNTFFIVRGTLIWGSVYIGPLYNNTIGLLLLITLLNYFWLKRKYPSWALRTGEMLTIYAILTMSTGLVGMAISVGGDLQAVITYPFWFVTTENRWRELLWPYLPTWLTVRDPVAVEGYWAGETTAYQWHVIKTWAVPAFWWASLMAAVFGVCLCLSAIVRRRWEDEEKLPFPFATMPVQLTDQTFGLFRSKAWWIGLGVAFSLAAWNQFAPYVPGLRPIPMGTDWYAALVNRWPWGPIVFNRFGGLGWSPGALGMCYLIPQDMLLSLIVFGQIFVIEEILSYSLGWAAPGQGFPFPDHQQMGGLIGVVLAIMWLDRRYIAQVIRRAFGLRSALEDESQEPLSYRVAFFGLLLGLFYCWWFWTRTGAAGWIVLLFLAFYFIMNACIMRIRAQVGSPCHEIWGGPILMMQSVLGTQGMGPRGIAMLNLLNPYLLLDQENNPAPTQLETFKMSEGGRMERRRIAMALALVTPFTIICSFWAYLHWGYYLGIGTAKANSGQMLVARSVIEGMDLQLRQPTQMNPSGTTAMGFGLVVTQILFYLKLRFAWWPLHPAAFPICHVWLMHYYNLAMFAVWLLKLLLMRYGGLRAHRAALPLFLGLLVGEHSVNFLRAIIITIFKIGMS